MLYNTLRILKLDASAQYESCQRLLQVIGKVLASLHKASDSQYLGNKYALI